MTDPVGLSDVRGVLASVMEGRELLATRAVYRCPCSGGLERPALSDDHAACTLPSRPEGHIWPVHCSNWDCREPQAAHGCQRTAYDVPLPRSEGLRLRDLSAALAGLEDPAPASMVWTRVARVLHSRLTGLPSHQRVIDDLVRLIGERWPVDGDDPPDTVADVMPLPSRPSAARGRMPPNKPRSPDQAVSAEAAPSPPKTPSPAAGRVCLWCGTPIDPARPAKTRFCKNSHRIARFKAEQRRKHGHEA